MKAISLWEPWGTAMKLRLKPDETRNWYTKHRGWLAIHTARKIFDPTDYAPEFTEQLKRDGIRQSDLIYGSLICIVYLVSCSKTQLVRGSRTAQQIMYGNYANDRFAWVTDPDKTIVLPQPVPFRGAQGLFEWPAGDLYIPESERVAEGLFA